MRKSLLASAAVLGMAAALAASGPAFAQDTTPAANAARMSAPDDGASPEQLLQSAQQDVQHHRRAPAQEALERAETRLLDRATAPAMANQPDSAPAVQEISQALQAVGKRDWQTAGMHIDAALQQAKMAQTGNGGMPSGGMPVAAMPAAAMPMTGAAAAPAAGTATPPAMGATPANAGMTAGTTSVPMGGVEPPNGGVMVPNGGVMRPNVP